MIWLDDASISFGLPPPNPDPNPPKPAPGPGLMKLLRRWSMSTLELWRYNMAQHCKYNCTRFATMNMMNMHCLERGCPCISENILEALCLQRFPPRIACSIISVICESIWISWSGSFLGSCTFCDPCSQLLTPRRMSCPFRQKGLVHQRTAAVSSQPATFHLTSGSLEGSETSICVYLVSLCSP